MIPGRSYKMMISMLMITTIFLVGSILVHSRIIDDTPMEADTMDQGIRVLHVGPHAPVAPPKKKQPKTTAPSSFPSYVPTTTTIPVTGMSQAPSTTHPSDVPTTYPSDAPVVYPSAAPSDRPSDVQSSIPSLGAASISDLFEKGKGSGVKGSMMMMM